MSVQIVNPCTKLAEPQKVEIKIMIVAKNSNNNTKSSSNMRPARPPNNALMNSFNATPVSPNIPIILSTEPGPYNPQLRHSFIKKVLLITFIMILSTGCFVCLVLVTPSLENFFKNVPFSYVFMPAFTMLFICQLSFITTTVVQNPPCSFVILGLTLITMSLLVARVAVAYSSPVIVYAVFTNAIVVFICFCLACSSFDFTRLLLYFIVCFAALLLVISVMYSVKIATGKWMSYELISIYVVSSLLQALLFTINLQLIFGGRAIEITEKNYVIATWLLYTSILDIFIKTVHIIGLSLGGTK